MRHPQYLSVSSVFKQIFSNVPFSFKVIKYCMVHYLKICEGVSKPILYQLAKVQWHQQYNWANFSCFFAVQYHQNYTDHYCQRLWGKVSEQPVTSEHIWNVVKFNSSTLTLSLAQMLLLAQAEQKSFAVYVTRNLDFLRTASKQQI